MRAKILTKSTAHKTQCLLCKKEIKKGEKVIRITQPTYPGTRVGYICNCVKKDMKELTK